MGLARPAVLLAVALLLLSAPPSPADDDVFSSFDDPARGTEDLAKELEADVAGLTSSGQWSVYDRGVYFCGRGSDQDRRRALDEVLAMEDRGRKALSALGLPVAAKLPDWTVVRIESPPGTGVVAVVPGKAVLVRSPPLAGSAAEPAVRRRIDGPPVLRDVVEAARAHAAWYGSFRDRAVVDGESGTLRHVLADRLVNGADLPKETPGWFRGGLSAWVAAGLRAGEPPPFGGTLPAGLAEGGKPAVERLFGDGPPAPESLPVLSRVVGALVKGRTDLRADAGKLAAAHGLEARGAAFGKDLAALAIETARALQPPAVRPSPDGAPACPLCGGTGRIDVSCPDCEGIGGVGCPSCHASGTCWAGNCAKGIQVYEGGRKVRCKFCSGGVTACIACGSRRRVSCLSCRGRGKLSLPCLACVKGHLPAPGAAAGSCTACGGSHQVPCPWCEKNTLPAACPECDGAGFLGCKVCFGTGRELCGDCDGTGETRMVYTDGTQASVTKCSSCGGRGFSDCRTCRGGKLECATCSGRGFQSEPRKACPACGGARKIPCPTCGGSWTAPPRAAAPEDAEANRVVLSKAVDFLLHSVSFNGAFALRKKGKDGSSGVLEAPTTFSNSQTLWALIVAGVPRDNPTVEAAWKVLAADAARIGSGAEKDAGVQATAFTLRALLVGGADPKGPVVRKLADILVAAQRPSGLWNYGIDGSGDEENILDSLIAIEALHVARSRGVKVSSACWNRAYQAGAAAFGARGPSKASSGELDAIDVVSNLALLVVSKAEMLGEKASTFDYLTIPDVQGGLAWLDRHFDVTAVPVFINGGRVHQKGGGCYFAWLFALQRLAMLLRIEEIGGESWHASGARHLRTLQRADGSFEEVPPSGANWSVRSTTDAALFLVRATVPITEPGVSR
jgi:hypothetical protein